MPIQKRTAEGSLRSAMTLLWRAQEGSEWWPGYDKMQVGPLILGSGGAAQSSYLLLLYIFL